MDNNFDLVAAKNLSDRLSKFLVQVEAFQWLNDNDDLSLDENENPLDPIELALLCTCPIKSHRDQLRSLLIQISEKNK